MISIPEGATHQWTPARTLQTNLLNIFQLSFYKFEDGKWWVYSDVTGWRKSQNDDAWFLTEIVEGWFKEIKQ